ncbi:MAG: 3-hydroxyacyl-CoA dehydrogenase NAD-binding domain-containing protein [Oscillospiraceae bacterium]|nr:3-hydroxyacyl-CoA dehydrogenase NAD-binding domain-containing protein [Oscillospiraceae bacterium]
MKDTVIGIVGLGMIGNSTAVLSTMHGYKTVCYVRNPAKEAVYKADFDKMYDEMIAQGILTAEQAKICGTYLVYVNDYEGMADCDIIFEAALENEDVKREVFGNIERCCPKIKAIGSCSSSMVPDKLVALCGKYADRVIVTHPFFPVHMVPYFELCASEKTAPGVVDYAKSVLEALDRKPVVLKKPNPGFIGNYLQFALWAACLKLVEDGVCEPKDIDTCLNYSFCPRYSSIGIFDHFDNGGYKLNITTCNSVFPILPRYEGAPDCIKEKAESPDAWGAKSPTKRGFYDWSNVDMVEYQKKVNAPYWKFINWELPTEECK